MPMLLHVSAFLTSRVEAIQCAVPSGSLGPPRRMCAAVPSFSRFNIHHYSMFSPCFNDWLDVPGPGSC